MAERAGAENAAGKNNGTLEIVALYLPDFLVAKPIPGQKMKKVEIYLMGEDRFTDLSEKIYQSSLIRILRVNILHAKDGSFSGQIAGDRSEIRAMFNIQPSFEAKKIKFVVDGKEMYYDIAAAKWE